MFDFISADFMNNPYPEEDPLYAEAADLAESLRDIGELLSERIRRVSEAMFDFDPDLVDRCVRELRRDSWPIAREAVEAYLALTELYALDRSLLPQGSRHTEHHLPRQLDASIWPAVPRKGVRKRIRVLVARTASCLAELESLEVFASDSIAECAHWLDVHDPVPTAATIIACVGAVIDRVEMNVELWQEFVIHPYRKLAATQRGLHPPRFVAFEAELDAIMAKFRSGGAAA